MQTFVMYDANDKQLSCRRACHLRRTRASGLRNSSVKLEVLQNSAAPRTKRYSGRSSIKGWDAAAWKAQKAERINSTSEAVQWWLMMF
eukprot:1021775-Pleurochrysis_carterae.AAC.1